MKKNVLVAFVVFKQLKENKLKKLLLAFLALLGVVAIAVGVAYPQTYSFESNTNGWNGWQSTLSRTASAGSPDGGYAATVTRSTGTSYTIQSNNNLFDQPLPAGDNVVLACAYVKAANSGTNGKTVYIKIREKTSAAGSLVGESSSVATTLSNTSWKQISVTRQLTNVANHVDVRVSQDGAVAGNVFHADGIYVVSYSSATAPEPCN